MRISRPLRGAALALPLLLRGLESRAFCGAVRPRPGRLARAARVEDGAAFGGFQGLGLSSAAEMAAASRGYRSPTEVQRQTFQAIRDGRNLVVRARTGAGKTLSFLLPTMDRLHQEAQGTVLVLSPVRELSMQIHAEAAKLAENFPGVSPLLMVGGSNWEEDVERLARASDALMLIATPGRLQTHLEKTPAFQERLRQVQVLVLDEADQLAGEIFGETTRGLLETLQLPPKAQHLFYSATVTREVTQLIAQVAEDHSYVDVLESKDVVPDSIVQTYRVVPTEEMTLSLWEAVEDARKYFSGDPPKMVVIFLTGRIAAYYAEVFRQSHCELEVFEIHSRMKQQQRTEQSEGFRRAARGLLFTSDVTSRGLDYPNVTSVVQVGAPDNRAEYVHRVGRTGRNERQGLGILLLHEFEGDFLAELQGLGLQPAEDRRLRRSNPEIQAELAALPVPENVKNQAYYSRINHVMRHAESVDVLEVFREAQRFADSIGALADGRPPALTEENARRYGVADISDPAINIVKDATPEVTISYQQMDAAALYAALPWLLARELREAGKAVAYFVHGDIAKHYAGLMRQDGPEVFEAHSAMSKKVRRRALQSFEAADCGLLLTAGLAPSSIPAAGVEAVILIGLPRSSKDYQQLVALVLRCEARGSLLISCFEEAILGAMGAQGLRAAPSELQPAKAVECRSAAQAYLAWLRHYGDHPMIEDKTEVIQQAKDLADAMGANGDAQTWSKAWDQLRKT